MIDEAAYKGNIGALEMVQLYQKATAKEIKEIEKIVNNGDWVSYKKIVKRILGVSLK